LNTAISPGKQETDMIYSNVRPRVFAVDEANIDRRADMTKRANNVRPYGFSDNSDHIKTLVGANCVRPLSPGEETSRCKVSRLDFYYHVRGLGTSGTTMFIVSPD
jgi:hypothetical protein